jgi:signal transduction histidine kinase
MVNQPAIRYPFASNEHERLREVREVLGPERDVDPVLQKIVERVRVLLSSPAALASVVEADHQWFLARVGVDLESTPRGYSICSRAIMSDRPLILPDTKAHREFATHPAVVSEPHVRFYVGAPIILSSGFRVGSLCGIDVEPHDVPPSESVEELEELAAEVARHLEEKHESRTCGGRRRRAEIAADARTEFLALVGHELRTPLTVLLGNALLLRARIPGQTERRMVEAIAASGKHLHQLIERILQFSSLEKGELFLAEEQVYFSDVIASAVVPMEPILNAAGRQIAVSCDLLESGFVGDKEQVCLALSSLVANAVTHGEGNVEVVAGRAEDGTLRLAVYDHGRGLPDGQLEKCDRPFTIGEDVDRRVKGGLGLGLPLAKKLMELHGGSIRSGSEQGRAVVELRLPAWRFADKIV